MNRDEAIEKLNECAENGDLEVAHLEADQVLCELLIELGYRDVIEAWHHVGKWYA